MKILNSLFIGILILTSFSVNSEVLPNPQKDGGTPLMEVIAARKSSRDISATSVVTKQDLSNMLWAGWGITHEDKHTIATAVNRQELSLYVITATEISKYNPETNTLTTVNKGDFRSFAAMQDFGKTAPVNIAFVVDTAKEKVPEFYGYAAGAASQNIYLYCAQAGLKTVLRASFDVRGLTKALKLGANEKVIFVQSVGK
jgi:hypothetical protein